MWHIDWGWGDITSELGDAPVKTMTHSEYYDQHFDMTQDGMLTIIKLENTVSRSTNEAVGMLADMCPSSMR